MSLGSVNGLPLKTSPTAMEEVASAAPRFQVGEPPPPVAQRVNPLSQSMKRPLDQSETSEVTVSMRSLSDTGEPPPPVVQRVNALSQSMKRPLDQSETSEVTVSKRALSDTIDHSLAVQNLAEAEINFAIASTLPHDSPQQMEKYQQALQIYEAIVPKSYIGIVSGVDQAITVHKKMSTCYLRLQREDRAVASLKKAVQLSEHYYPNPHQVTARLYLELAGLLLLRQPREGLRAARNGVEMLEKIYGHPSEDMANAYFVLGRAHHFLEEYELASERYDESLKIFRALPGENSAMIGAVLIAKGNVLIEQKAFNEALEMMQQGLRMLQSTLESQHGQLVVPALLRSAFIRNLLAKHEEALADLQNAWTIVHIGHPDRAEISYAMGLTLDHLSRHREALSFYVTAFQDALREQEQTQIEYFHKLYKSLKRHSDSQDVVKTADELLPFCIQHCGEVSMYVIQLRRLISARTKSCWLM